MNERTNGKTESRGANGTVASAEGVARPIEVGALQEPDRAVAGPALAPSQALLGALRNVKVQVSVRVGGAEVTLGDLLEVRPQQVLVLAQLLEDPVEMLVENRVVARGHLVAVDDCFGVRISEVPAPVELAGSVGEGG